MFLHHPEGDDPNAFDQTLMIQDFEQPCREQRPAGRLERLVDVGQSQGETHHAVGYFADPRIAFVQTPQDYRGWEGNKYLTACYDAYRYFFATAMPSRIWKNSSRDMGTKPQLRFQAAP